MEKLYCIAVGNLQTGMNFHGPFTAEDANDEMKHESINPKFLLEIQDSSDEEFDENKEEKWIIVKGDLLSGFQIHGFYYDSVDAAESCEQYENAIIALLD